MYYAISEIAGPIILLIATVVGRMLDPSYSHAAKTVSKLMARGAPNKVVVDSIMFFSNIAVI
jgi:hypothetical protein